METGRGVWGEEKGGKVYGKGVGAKVTAKQSPKLLINPL